MTCKDCIHRDVCYKRESVPDENYAEKCGDFISDKVLEERPKGEWELFNSYYRKCNKCERMVGFDYADPDHGNWFNFCPNCGAEMKGGAE